MLRWLRRVPWRWLRWPLIAILGLGLVLLLLWAVVVVPPNLIDVSQIPNAADQAKAVNDLRTTLAGVLGGLAVAGGAVVAALNFRETSRQNRAILDQQRQTLVETQLQNAAIQEQNRGVLELQRRGQVTERFTRAIDQLGQQGPDTLDVRIGAVYALEQIARDSAELYWPIMEVLTAYLREHARTGTAAEEADEPPPQRLAADHQAIASVLRRRREDQAGDQRLDLHETDLHGANLSAANLRGANLRGASLRRANLREADLRGADLREADLREADLRWTRLDMAHVDWVDDLPEDSYQLEQLGAILFGVDMRGGTRGTSSFTADLRGADLRGADLFQATVDGANLEGAILNGATGVTLEQLRSAAGSWDAQLPPELAEQLAQTPQPAAEDAVEPAQGGPPRPVPN